MRRLVSVSLVVALSFALASGCGSTADGPGGNDALVFHFVGWSGDAITQADSVNASSADVDVVENCCLAMGGMDLTLEHFTQTVINATFHNAEGLDITLSGYTIHFDDPRSQVGDVSLPLSAVIPGGRCRNESTRQCSTAADCRPGTVTFCDFTDTTVGSILLFDFSLKEHIPLEIYGRGQPLTITFSGRDSLNRSFNATARYTPTFANYCNCATGETCVSCPG